MSRYDYLTDFLEEFQPETIIEIGTWNGKTARSMIKAAKAKRYVGFDLFDEGSEDLHRDEYNVKPRSTKEEAEKNLEMDGVEVELIQGNSRDTLPAYAKGKKPFAQFAFVDGGHSVGTIKRDILTVSSLVTQDGVIFVDDYYFGNPKQDVGANNVLHELSVPFTIIPGNDVAGTKADQKFQVRLARINMQDMPRHLWEEEAVKGWRFAP